MSDTGQHHHPQSKADQLGELIDKSVNIGAENRRRIKVLTVPLLIDVFLSAVIGWSVLRVNQSQHQANVDRKAECARSNLTRAGEIHLWEGVLGATTPPTLKPDANEAERQAFAQAQAVRTKFEQDLHTYFDPLDC